MEDSYKNVSGPYGFEGGKSFTDETVALFDPPTEIIIRSDDIVDGIQIKYGTKWANFHGVMKAGDVHNIKIDEDDTIAKVTGVTGSEFQGSNSVQQLTFHTKKGKVHGPYGKLSKGTSFTAAAPNENWAFGHICGESFDLGFKKMSFVWIKANFFKMSTTCKVENLLKSDSSIVMKSADICFKILDVAIKDSNIHILRLLQEAGLDFNVPMTGVSKKGRTALHNSVLDRKRAVIQFLLDAGVNVCVKDKEGKNPLHYAIKLKDIEMGKLLIEYGAEMSKSIDNNGWEEYDNLFKYHQDFKLAVKDEKIKDENKYANLSSSEVQCMKELKVRELKEVKSGINTLNIKISELADLKKAKLLEVEEKEGAHSDTSKAKLKSLEVLIAAAKKELYELEAKLESEKQNSIKVNSELTEERKRIHEEMDKEQENLMKEHFEKSTKRFKFHHELSLINNECVRRGNVVPPRNVNQGLLHFLEKQIKNLETELECPVCLHPSEVPIYTCSEQHIICALCWKKISSANNLCPSCRAPFPDPPVKHRFMERMAEQLKKSYQELDQLLSSNN